MIWTRVGMAVVGTLGVLALRGDGRDYGRAATAADRVPRSVAEAEREGKAHPARPSDGERAFAAAPAKDGTAERRCVNADFHNTRTGDFIIGPLHSDVPLPGDGKMYFIPARPERPGQGKVPLVVRITRIDSAGPAVQRVYRTDGLNAAGGPDREPFYATGIVFPALGRYLLVATAGENWGCLLVYGGVRRN